MKILITGGKTATALKLTKAFQNQEIVLGDYGDLPSIKTNSYSFLNLGEWNADVLAHQLLSKCLDEGVSVLLPLYEAEIEAIAKSSVLYDEFGIKVLVPEKPQFKQSTFKNWCVFEKNELIYISTELTFDKVKDNINGAYYFPNEGNELCLISVPNPS